MSYRHPVRSEVFSRSEGSCRSVFPIVCLLALWAAMTALCLAVSPQDAWAYFDQVDEKNSAQQDIGDYGKAVSASEIPDGTYIVPVRTTSRMCVLYNTAADAATRSDNKELCTVTVKDGSMTASFFMSPAYTHIFMGSGAQAKELTDKTGTDDSAYVKGIAYPVAVGNSTSNAYFYTMQIPALNKSIAFASYDGGSAGIEEGKWFDRQVVFKPSDEIEGLMGKTKESAKQKSDKEQIKQSESSATGDETTSQPEIIYVYEDEPVTRSGTVGAPSAPPVESKAADRSVADAKRGILISPVRFEPPSASDDASAGAPITEGQDDRQVPTAWLLLIGALAIAALLGCAIRTAQFAVSKSAREG